MWSQVRPCLFRITIDKDPLSVFDSSDRNQRTISIVDLKLRRKGYGISRHRYDSERWVRCHSLTLIHWETFAAAWNKRLQSLVIDPESQVLKNKTSKMGHNETAIWALGSTFLLLNRMVQSSWKSERECYVIWRYDWCRTYVCSQHWVYYWICRCWIEELLFMLAGFPVFWGLLKAKRL